MFSRSSYVSIPSHGIELGADSGEEGGDVEGKPPRSQSLSDITHWAFAATLICIAINIAILYMKLRTNGAARSLHDTYGLEFVSPYIGLDTAARDPAAPPPPPISSFPIASGIVNKSSPKTVYLETYDRKTFFGTISPAEWHIYTDAEVTTILQFWAGDFGMERCSLELSPPVLKSHFIHDKVPRTSLSPSKVQIHQVNATHPLDARKLSYAQRPERNGLLAEWTILNNATRESPEFACPSGTFQSFEVACIGKGCLLNFRQTPQEESPGFWLIQRSSS